MNATIRKKELAAGSAVGWLTCVTRPQIATAWTNGLGTIPCRIMPRSADVKQTLALATTVTRDITPTALEAIIAAVM
jgi:hypothetical protein